MTDSSTKKYTLTTTGKSKVGCLDACFRGARRPDEFDPKMEDLSCWDVVELLKLSQVGVLSIVIAQVILHVLWSLATIVPGFVLFDGASGVYSAYTHAGWWLAIDYVISVMGAAAVFFGFNYAANTGVLEKGVERTVHWLQSYAIVLGFGVISNLIHAGFTLSELSNCTSTLCTTQYWCLVMLVVFLFASSVLLAWGATRVYAFMYNLKYAMMFNLIDMEIGRCGAPPSSDKKPIDVIPIMPDLPAEVTTTQQKVAPAFSQIKSSISPMLEETRRKQQGSRPGVKLDPQRPNRK